MTEFWQGKINGSKHYYCLYHKTEGSIPLLPLLWLQPHSTFGQKPAARWVRCLVLTHITPPKQHTSVAQDLSLAAGVRQGAKACILRSWVPSCYYFSQSSTWLELKNKSEQWIEVLITNFALTVIITERQSYLTKFFSCIHL